MDSWLPPEAALFLSKATAAQGWSQLEEAVDSGEPVLDGDPVSAEWKDMPKTGRDYHILMDLDFLEIGVVDSMDGGDQTPVDSPDGESEVVLEESKGSEGEGVPFYYCREGHWPSRHSFLSLKRSGQVIAAGWDFPGGVQLPSRISPVWLLPGEIRLEC